MFKKLTSIVLGVLLVSLMVPGLAWADDGAPAGAAGPEHRPHGRGGGGEITALGADNFTVTGLRGNVRTFYVETDTEFLDRDAQPMSFADLEIGQRALVAAARADGDQTIALWVRVFPPRTHYRGVGTVTGVEAAEPAFTFTNPRGREWEFYVDADTQYRDRSGDTHTFEDLAVGTQLFVQAELRADGQWWATVLRFPAPKVESQP